MANCLNLGFQPKLSFKMNGGTERGDHPALSATLVTKPGDANLRRVQVTLPPSVLIDQGHIRTVCTRVQYAADECPQGSIYGFAKAWSPLLDQPVEGPVILRSNPEHEVPDLVMDLRGLIDVNVVGVIDAVNGRNRTTFEGIPDQPVSKFELTLQGGGKGLLVDSKSLCGHHPKASGSDRRPERPDGRSETGDEGELRRGRQAQTPSQKAPQEAPKSPSSRKGGLTDG